MLSPGQMPEASCWSGYFRFDEADPIYREHFPGTAAVPGSVIVEAFVNALLPKHATATGLRCHDFRFNAFVRPGLHEARIEQRGDRYLCALGPAEAPLATGSITIT